MARVTTTDCTDWRGLMAMDAIGRTSDRERRLLQGHLSHCDTCRADALQVGEAARALAVVDRAALTDPGSVDGHRVDGQPVDASPGPFPALVVLPSGDKPSEGTVEERPPRPGHRRRWVAVGTVAAAVIVAVGFLLSQAPASPARTVALSGQPGVHASISLSGQKWGTRATLRESGQAGGQVLTVSMQAASGRWWVAGSYRTVGGRRTVTVELTCAVPVKEVAAVWVRDAQGRTVLDGYP
jgi:hypothetical protein